MKFKDKILYNLIQSIYKLYLYLWNQIKEAIEIKGVFFPFISGKALLGLLLQQRGSKTNSSFPCSLAHSPEQQECGGGEVFPYMQRGYGCVQGWRAGRGGPPRGLECRGHTQYPAFALNILLLLQALQKCQLGFWSLCIFCPEFAPAVHAPRRVFIESRIETIKPCQGTCSFPVYLLPWWRALLAPSLLAM